MAPSVTTLQSRVLINATQSYITPGSSQASSPAPPQTTQRTQGTEVVEDSFKDGDKAKQVKPPRPSTTAPVDDDDDLYSISPRREAADHAIVTTQQSRDEKIQDADDDDSERKHHTNQDQAAAIAKAALAAELDNTRVEQGIFPAFTPPQKLKLLTQRTSEPDTLKPTFQKTDPVEHSMSSRGGDRAQSSTSRKPEPTSQTSAMVSARKSGSDAAPPTSTQATGKKSTLEALMAKKGLSSKPQSLSSAMDSQPDASLKSMTAKTQSKAFSPVKQTAKTAIASTDREETSQGKKAVSRSSNSQIAPAEPSNSKRTSLRESVQVETSRTEAAEPSAATHQDVSMQEDSLNNASTATQEQGKKGKLKKPSLSGNGKAKKVADDPADSEVLETRAVKEIRKPSRPVDSQPSRQTQPSEHEDGEDGNEEQSQPRKRGKGALPSISKRPARTQRKQAESSQAGEPDSDFELTTSSPKKRDGRKTKDTQATKKAAPKAKSTKPTTRVTARITRAQAADAQTQKPPSDDVGSGQASPARKETKPAKNTQQGKSVVAEAVVKAGTKRKSQARAVDEPDEVEDDSLTVEAEPLPQKKAALGKGKSKVESPVSKSKGDQASRKQPTRVSPRQVMPGGSQENAIELSDGHQSSSPLPPSPAAEPKRQTQIQAQEDSPSRNTRSRARTPANIPSSPPTQPQYGMQHLDPISATARSRKTAIIGFGKDGPRNQGTLSGKTPGSRSARGNHSPMRSTKVPLADGRKTDVARGKRASSVATTTRTARTNKSAAPSNVADDVGDALAGLRGKTNVAQDVGDALSDLKEMVTKDPVIATASKQKTISAVDAIEPKQKTVPAADPQPQDDYDDGFVNIDDYEETTLFEPDVQETRSPKPLSFNRSASQLAMPPPTKVPAKSTRPAVLAAQDDDETRAPAEVVPKTSGAKRAREPDTTAERATKRTKASEMPAPQQEAAVTRASVATGKQKITAPKEDTPIPRKETTAVVESVKETSRKRARGAEVLHESSEKRVKLASKPSEERPAKVPAPVQETMTHQASSSKRESRAGRRPVQRRQTSQNSQTVDMGGSPVPPDMEVMGQNTVLETFSQQAGLSPDVSSELPMAFGQPFEARARTASQHSNSSDAFRPPPSHQAGVLSSNVKPRPAAPEAESAIIPRVSLRDLESLNRRSPLAQAEDPFNSSQDGASQNESQRSEPRVSRISNLDAVTKRFDLFGDKFEHRDPIKKEKKKSIFARVKSPPRPSPPAPVITNGYIRSTQKHHDQLRKMARPHQRPQPEPEEEDPDKTLVNDDDEDEAAQEVDQDQQAALEEYDEHDEEASTVADEMGLSGLASDDLMSWCKTLRPHQLNLFEELLKCSHRITQFFTEQENNIERTLAEQHEMGLHVIEQDELLRAKKYEQLKEKLSRTKFESKKDIKAQQEQMKKNLSARAKEKSARIIAMGLREQGNRELEALLEGLVAS
ncbi:hypothetical protein PRZ48_008054 [Zasmidium cellare]|uniref:Uncharacterized protein n=1 Tax=Zasmidium cellare TaxID=395010 RepID=A0ABR0EFN5_ZASCE|nr:hypothetical protein PRZ48_008054 [Zasmidium cellare]